MEPEPRRWSDADREKFWELVRGRIAQRRLRQDDVARAINISRSGLSRRLSGDIKDRPDELMIQQFGEVLKLEPTELERLHELAGYAEVSDDQQAAAFAMEVVPPITSRSRRRSRQHVVALCIAVLLLALVTTLAVMLFNGTTSPRLGGVWDRPQPNETVTGPLHLAARGYRANRALPAVAFVEFTLSWDGRPGPWLVACHVTVPTYADLYDCDFDPSTVAAPPGQLHMSFDVYDEHGDVTHAPNGVRTITYIR